MLKIISSVRYVNYLNKYINTIKRQQQTEKKKQKTKNYTFNEIDNQNTLLLELKISFDL